MTSQRPLTERPAFVEIPAWSDKPVAVVVIGETRMKYVVRVLYDTKRCDAGAERHVPRRQVTFLDSENSDA